MDGEIHDFSHFLLWEQASRDAILVKRVYIDMAGDLAAGVLLSQIIYWHLPNDEGRTRLRVEADGYLWLVKGYTDWWEECRLTFKQARRAVEILQEKKLIVTCNRKFNGAPRLHIRINREPFLQALNGFALQGKSTCPVGQIEMPQRANEHVLEGKSYKQRVQTDTTTENTAAAEASPVSSDTVVPRKSQRKGSADAVSFEEKEGVPDTETSALIDALVSADLNRSDAKRFAVDSPDEARRQLNYLPFKQGLENPGGYLRSAIEGGFPPPKEYKAAKAREERDRKKRESLDRARTEATAPSASEKEKCTRESIPAVEPHDPLGDVWNVALAHLEEVVNSPTMNAHLKPMRLVSISDGKDGEPDAAVLIAKTAFAKTWIEGHNRAAVEAALCEALGRPVSVRITAGEK